MITTIHESQRKAARVAGFAYLFTFVIVVLINFGIHERLLVAGNIAETARNIVAHQGLFRIGIAGDMVYCAALVVLLTSLYVVLKPVSPGLAMLAAFWRLVYALLWVLMTLRLFEALRILTVADYLRAFEADRLQALTRLSLSARFDQYYVGLLFFGLASTVCAYLLFKSRYIPRVLAGFGVVGSAWAVVCTLAFIISPDFAKVVNLWWFDTPLGLFELATGFWLLFKGIRTPLVE